MNLKPLVIGGALLCVFVAAPSHAQAPKPDPKTLAATGILERLAERSGVYGVPPTAKVPGFIADAGWPQKLPNNWIIGQVGGLYVAPDDHIWVYQRPRTPDQRRGGADQCDAQVQGRQARRRAGLSASVWRARRLLPAGAVGDGVRCKRQAAALLGRPGRSRTSARWRRLRLAGQRARHLRRSQRLRLSRRQQRQWQSKRLRLGVEQRRRRHDPEVHQGRQVRDDDRRPGSQGARQQ